MLSQVQLFATPWAVAYHAPPSMGFSRQEYWSRLPFPSPKDLPDPGIEPRSPALPSEPPGKSQYEVKQLLNVRILAFNKGRFITVVMKQCPRDKMQLLSAHTQWVSGKLLNLWRPQSYYGFNRLNGPRSPHPHKILFQYKWI